jgi:hypothetical protein
MEDPSKFFNVIIDKTNQKLNSFQAQIIVLESQLQMANDEKDTYKKYVEELPALNFNITAFEDLKKEFEHCQKELNKAQEEISTYKSLVESLQNTCNENIRTLENSNSENLRVLEEKYVEQIQVLQDKNTDLESKFNSGSSFLKDQNETLLQEIRRLKAEMAGMSSK